MKNRHGIFASKSAFNSLESSSRFSLQSVKHASACASAAALLCLISGTAGAAGFALGEMSAASLGVAHAGGAAEASDASTVFYNPAGLMRMSGSQISLTGSGITPKIEFSNQGSLSGAGNAATGGNGGDAGDLEFVPAMFYATDIAPNLRFGIGLTVPFGLTTDYDSGWAGRYQALKSQVKTVNINPVIAWRVNEKLSLGGGVSAQYIDVKLSKAIDFGTVCVGSLGAANCAPSGSLPQNKDGKVTVDGNDWGFGFNVGALYEMTPSTRFGAAYRSRIIHRLSGNASYDIPAGLPAILAASPTFSNTGVNAGLDLPDSVDLSAAFDLDPKWTLLTDISWMNWSRFKELRISFNNGAADSVTQEQWRNTLRYAIGTTYKYDEKWLLRTGVAYDQTPVKSEFRTGRVPDNNRIWLGLGAQYKLTARSAIDVGYVHMFVKDSSINKSEPPVGGTQTGTYSENVNIVSVQYNYSF
ncbi:MAG: OmpP1/FadL family transporter [Janthinobacterium lividum]